MKIAYMAPALRVDDSYAHKSEHLFAQSGRNTGNFAFVQAIHGHIDDEIDIVPWHADPDHIRENYDLLVFACANQLGPHSDLGDLAARLEKMKLPIVAIGLGAQAKNAEADITLTDGTRRWVEVIAASAPSSSPNIGMRGAFSLRQMQNLGLEKHAIIMGCPSNFLNSDPTLQDKLKAKYEAGNFHRIAVPAGLHLWQQLKTIEQQLAKLVDQTKGSYVSQSELDMIRITRGEFDTIEPAVLAALNDYIKPDLSLEDFKIWCRRYGVAYKDATSWMEAMRTHDFVVGPRFHGIMLAFQAGTPGGVISHDSRTYELCKTMGIPVLPHEQVTKEITVEGLKDMFPFDAENYSRTRTTLGKAYLGILEAAGIKAKKELVQLINQ